MKSREIYTLENNQYVGTHDRHSHWKCEILPSERKNKLENMTAMQFTLQIESWKI